MRYRVRASCGCDYFIEDEMMLGKLLLGCSFKPMELGRQGKKRKITMLRVGLKVEVIKIRAGSGFNTKNHAKIHKFAGFAGRKMLLLVGLEFWS